MKKILKNCLIATTLLTVIGGGSLLAINSDSNNSQQLSENTTIKTNGVQLKLLQTTTNSFGEKDQTFTYTINPYNASNQQIEVTLTYIDGTDCSSVMSYTLDATNRTITLSCKADFDKQIKCKLVSKANSAAYSEVTVDYVKKIKKIYLDADDYNYISIGDTGDEDDGDNLVRKYVDVTQDFTTTYSKYTKDQTYNIKLKEADKYKLFFLNYEYQVELKSFLETDPTLVTSLENYINDLVINPRDYSYEDLWDLQADNIEKWHTILLNEYIRGYDLYTPRIYFKLDCGAHYLFEDTITHQTYDSNLINGYTIDLVIHGDLSKYYINVDSIEVEKSTLEF